MPFGYSFSVEPTPRLDFRRLRYFLAVCEELNVSRAAQGLHMAQPALSKQMKQLETDLGLQLFDRVSRGVQLTEAGQLLLEQARRIFVQIEQTQSLIQRVGRGEVGQISLGFTPSASIDVLPPILRAYQNRYPEVELALYEMRADRLVERLSNQWVDLCFLFLPFEDDRFHCRVVSNVPLVAALPSGHPLSSEPKVSVAALRDEPFILPARHRRMPGLYGQITDLCRQAGFTPKAVQRDVWLMQTIVGLVAGGIGIALVPSPCASSTGGTSSTRRSKTRWRP